MMRSFLELFNKCSTVINGILAMEILLNFLNQDINIPESAIIMLRLIVTSENGCTDSLIVINAFSGSEYFIEFPKCFYS